MINPPNTVKSTMAAGPRTTMPNPHIESVDEIKKNISEFKKDLVHEMNTKLKKIDKQEHLFKEVKKESEEFVDDMK